MTHFAESLKKLREESNFSMQALADKAKVSKSMISKIERDEVQPTLDVASRLAKALGKTLSEMLHTTQTMTMMHLPKEEQAVWQDAKGIYRQNISPVFEGLKIEWLHVKIPVRSSILKCSSVNSTGVERYILVIKGILEVRINDQIFKIKKGDSFYFNANCAYECLNAGKEVLEYYIVLKYE